MFDEWYCPVRTPAGELSGYVSLDGTLEQIGGPDHAVGDIRLCVYEPDESPVCCGLYTVALVRL